MDDYVRNTLTECGLSELIEKFKGKVYPCFCGNFQLQLYNFNYNDDNTINNPKK